jgi:hypothetical protein
MPGLDDSRVDGADGNLMQAIAFRRQEAVGRGLRQGVDAISQREARTPAVVIKPRAWIGRPFRRQAKQIVNGALQSKRRRVMLADRRITAVETIQADDRDFRRIPIHDRHVHRRGFSPEAKQAPASLRQLACCKMPNGGIDHGPRPRAVFLDLAALQHEIDQRWHILLILDLSKKASHMLEPDDQRRGKVDSRAQNQ